jgi:hypothetical protein
MTTLEFPFVSQSLIEVLEERFKDRLPDSPDVSPTKMAYLMGQVSVVRYLKEIHREQTTNILEK